MRNTFAQHLAADAKQLIEDEETGAKSYRYVRTGVNHYSLAFTYDWMASENDRRHYEGFILFGDDDDDDSMRTIMWPALKAMERETGMRWPYRTPDVF